MNDAKLRLSIKPTQSAGSLCYDLVGVIDVDAAAILQPLANLPDDCQCVELNLAAVQRVNSMGLAHLLKLFEAWQARRIEIRVSNANRMISVLFKMTGLAHYLYSQPTAAPASSAGFSSTTDTIENAPPPSFIDAPDLSPAKPAIPANPPSPVNLKSPAGDKLKFWVSVQSSQQMHGWYFFNTYLQRQLGREIHMELIHGPIPESRLREVTMDLVFCKPFDAVRMLMEQQFLPLAYPSQQSDEVTLLARVDDPRSELSAFKNGVAATATRDDFVYLLGRFLLEEDEAALQAMDYQFLGCDIKTLQALIKGKADIAFLLSDSYRGLSNMTKSKLRVLDQSDTQFTFHLFSLAPHCIELAAPLESILLDMTENYQGRQILRDLGLAGWSKPARDEIDMLTQLYRRYR